MTVWVVHEDVDCECDMVVGVYASLEKAIRSGNRYVARCYPKVMKRLSASTRSVDGRGWSVGIFPERVR